MAYLKWNFSKPNLTFQGFLSLTDEECDIPGNAGLKDQVLALKWIKNNCHFFGGDAENITVFGESAGAASTHYLTLTEQTRGLFHKAVAMSGCAMAPWANIPHLNWAFRLAQATGYKGENKDREVLDYLKQLRPSVMFKACDELLTMEERQHSRLNFGFGPCVEPYKTPHCFMDKEPLQMLKDNWGNKIPLLIGGNSFEGLLAFSEVRKYPYLLNNLEEGESLPPLDAKLTKEKRVEYGRKLKQAYFGDKETSWETILQYSDVSRIEKGNHPQSSNFSYRHILESITSYFYLNFLAHFVQIFLAWHTPHFAGTTSICHSAHLFISL